MEQQILSREDLLKASGLKIEEREHPTLGMMRIRELSARQRIKWQEMARDTAKSDRTAAYFLQCSLVDAKDMPLFRSVEEVLRWMDDVSGEVSDPIFEAILDVNGIDVDELSENFTGTGNGDSDSG